MTGITNATCETVLERLGFGSWPEADAESLGRLYAAWCRRVPFDNVQKRIYFGGARRGPLPGASPEAFFSSWLAHGTGGTCWAGTGALVALLESLGFTVARGLATMVASPETRGPNHGTVVVELSGRHYLVDSSMLTGVPIPLEDGEAAAGPIAGGARLDAIADPVCVHWRPLHREEAIACRIETIGVGAEMLASLHEETRRWSPFNYGLSARVLRDDETLGLAGMRRARLRQDGSTDSVVLGAEDRLRCLVEDFGISEAIANALPPDEPMPPPPGA